MPRRAELANSACAGSGSAGSKGRFSACGSSFCAVREPCAKCPVLPVLQGAEADLLRISNKVRFILAVVGGRLKLSNRRKADIEAELEAEGYDKLPTQKKAQQQVGAAEE